MYVFHTSKDFVEQCIWTPFPRNNSLSELPYVETSDSYSSYEVRSGSICDDCIVSFLPSCDPPSCMQHIQPYTLDSRASATQLWLHPGGGFVKPRWHIGGTSLQELSRHGAYNPSQHLFQHG
jgi:hypothetical protein